MRSEEKGRQTQDRRRSWRSLQSIKRISINFEKRNFETNASGYQDDTESKTDLLCTASELRLSFGKLPSPKGLGLLVF